jgi:hypothetical protein
MARQLIIEDDVECCGECVYKVNEEVDVRCYHPDHGQSYPVITYHLEKIHPLCPLDELEFESEIE